MIIGKIVFSPNLGCLSCLYFSICFITNFGGCFSDPENVLPVLVSILKTYKSWLKIYRHMEINALQTRYHLANIL